MKRVSLICILTILFLVNAGAANAQEWKSTLYFSENAALQDSLEYGIHPSATSGINEFLGELELPPLPPAGVFDVRFTGADLGLGVRRDIRRTTSETIEYVIDIQRAAGGEITISWGALPAGEFFLQDMFGGIFFNVDMTSVSEAAVPAAVNQIKLLVTPVVVIKGPDIFDINVVGRFTDSLRFSWLTDVPATTEVGWGLPDGITEFVTIDSVIVTDLSLYHEATATGLLPATEYIFWFRAKDERGVFGPPVIRKAQTVAFADFTAPVIVSQPRIVARDTGSVIINFSTNEPTFAFIEYNETALWAGQGSGIIQDEPAPMPIHFLRIEGLLPGIEYTAVVGVTDVSGNGPVMSGAFTFETLSEINLDLPVFEEYPVAVGIDTSTATIKFKTNKPTIGVVRYAEAQNFDDESAVIMEWDSTLALEHKITLFGLQSQTPYTFIVAAIDANGLGPVISPPSNFVTLGESDNDPPVVVEGPIFDIVDNTQVMIRWRTDEVGTSIVWYSKGDILEEFPMEIELFELGRDHHVLLSGLQPDTMYTYKVGSKDAFGNGPGESAIFQFFTPAVQLIEPPFFELFPEVVRVDTGSAEIVIQTNKLTTFTLKYNTDSLFNLSIFEIVEGNTLGRSHRVLLTGLRPGKGYRFFVTITGTAGMALESPPFQFFTSLQADTRPPLILGFPSVIEKDATLVTIQWFTDEVSSSVIEYNRAGQFQSGTAGAVNIIWEDPALTTNHVVTLTGLQPGKKYEYTVKSSDARGNQSVSRRFSFETRGQADVNPPIIVDIPFIAHIDTNSAVIQWETDERATSIIEYALDADFDDTSLRLVQTDLAPVNAHTVTLTGLTLGQQYRFRVGSTDARGNGPTYSSVFEFITLINADLAPPVIFGFPEVRFIDAASVVVRWFTDERSNSRVEYFPLDNPDAIQIREQQTLTIEHNVLLKDLQPGIEYSYTVYSTDGNNNGPTVKGPFEFTRITGTDVIPPVFDEYPFPAVIDTSFFVVGFRADEPVNAIVDYVRTDTPQDTFTVDDQTFMLKHKVFVGGLVPGTSYSVRARAYDEAGNGPAQSAWFNVTTKLIADRQPPKVKGFPDIVGVDVSSVSLFFETNEPAIYSVEYGLVTDFPNVVSTIRSQNFNLVHNLTLTNLVQDQRYAFRVRLTDQAGNTSQYTGVREFRTLNTADVIPPQILGFPVINSLGVDKVSMEWVTNEVANSIVLVINSSDTTRIVDQQLTDMHKVIVKNLIPSTEYTFIAGSTDRHGNGPRYSIPFSYRTSETADTQPPKIVGFPTVTAIDTSNATVLWKTNKPGNNIIEYGPAETWPALFEVYVDERLALDHSVLLTDLVPGTEYVYRVGSDDAFRNGASFSPDKRFRTKVTADLSPPGIIGVPFVTGIDTNRVTAGWLTNEIATSIVECFVPGGDTLRIEENALIQVHTVLVSNLQQNTEYHYRVGSIDAASNGPVYSRWFSFKTSKKRDVTPPRIVGIAVAEGTDTNSTTIAWKTNEAANGIVEFAEESVWSTSIPHIIVDQKLVQEHRVFIPNLQSGLTYRYRVSSMDEYGNGPTVGFDRTFTTRSAADVKPPFMIGYPEASNIDTNLVVITFETDEPGNTIAFIWEEGSLDTLLVEDQALVISHSIFIDGLTPDTRYSVKVGSIDASNNEVIYERHIVSFKTLAGVDNIPPVFEGLPRITNLDSSSVTIGVRLNEDVEVTMIIAQAAYFNVADSQFTIREPVLQREHLIDIFDLIQGTSYMFKVTAIDKNGNGPSETPEFEFTTPEQDDIFPPKIIGFPVVSNTDTNFARIKFVTNENANAELYYWPLGTPQDVTIATDPSLVRVHELFMSNLTPGTEYEAFVQAIDRKGNGPTVSGTFRLKTLESADISPPVLIGVPSLESIDTTKAIIVFKTNEEGTTVIRYIGEGTPDDTLEYVDQGLAIDHRAFLTGLTPDMTYRYRVGSVDAKLNGPRFSPLFNFRTPAKPDIEPPVLLGVPSESNLDTSSVTIVWGTDEPANGRVDIRLVGNPASNRIILDGDLGMLHEVFVSGLIPDTQYEYRVSSVDRNNNGPSYYDDDPDRWFQFRTSAAADVSPPQITFWPSVLNMAHNSVTIKLKTNKVSFISIRFGTTTDLTEQFQVLEGRKEHIVQLSNLADSTQYFFKVEGKDIQGNFFEFPNEAPLAFFTLPEPAVVDTAPPRLVEGPVELDIESDRMTIFWRTDKVANSTVDFGINRQQFDQTASIDNVNLTIAHKVRLTNLIADTTYYYRIRSRGLNNAEYILDDTLSIRTLSGRDLNEVIIMQGPITKLVQDSTATIEWLTNKNASSRVDFGTAQGALDFTRKENEIDGVKFHQVKLTDLMPGTQYFYRVASIGANGLEAESNIFSFRTNALPDLTPPRMLAGPDAVSIKHDAVTIEWVTDELSNSVVMFGIMTAGDPVYTNTVWVDKDASGVTQHKAVITGFELGTEYDYIVRSADLSPQINWLQSRNKRFRTLDAPDTIPPVMTNGPIVDRNDRTATFEWDTDELSDSFVYIRKTDEFGNPIEPNFRKFGDETKVLKHIVTVTDLEPGQGYEFEIASRDLAGNLFTWPTAALSNSISATLSLRKVSQPPGGGGSFFTDENPDTQPPIIIEGPTVAAKTANTITVQWKTDERSDSFIDYGLNESYGSNQGDAVDVTDHSLTLTNLDTGTLYNFRVSSTDPNNIGPTLSLNSVVTTEAESDVTPPKITAGPVVEASTDDQATITWETDEHSDTYVEFGETDSYGEVRVITTDTKVHVMTLTNLSASTTYHYRIGSTDISDNGPTLSDDLTFATPAGPDDTPPVISNVDVPTKTDSIATITFDTDELGDTFVNFGLTDALGLAVGSTQDVTAHEITLTNLTPNSTYHYQVGSINKTGLETLHTIDTFVTAAESDTDAPAAPSGVDATAGDEQVLVRWNASAEEDLAGYNISRDAGGGFVTIATLVADTFYYDSGLANGITYQYKLTAVDASDNISSESSADGDTPDPANAPAVPEPEFPIDDRPTNPSDINPKVTNSETRHADRQELVYEFVIAEESDFFNQVGSGDNVAEGDGSTAWNSGLTLTDGATYYWKARAFDGLFYSDWTATQSFIIDALVVGVELIGFWANDEEGRVVLGWETASESDAAGYNLYRSRSRENGFERITEKMIDAGRTDYRFVDDGVRVGLCYFYKLEFVSGSGHGLEFEPVEILVSAPRTYRLHENYPNPFNPETTIKFELPKQDRVRLIIYNVLGQQVKALLDTEKEAGFHDITWDGTDDFGRLAASGVYFYRIASGSFVQTKKMLLIK
ncbi:fibronectin type III domain-containing protein [candidate division KSB1 bacterium]